MSEPARRTLVRGGTVVTAAGSAVADVRLADGTIVEIGRLEAGPGEEVVDAAGCYVLPGGVDFHTHIDAVFRGSIRTADDWRTGSAAAAAGGTTTVVDFCRAEDGQPLAEAIGEWRDRVAAQDPWIDYGVHAILVQPDEERLAELDALPGLGVASVKLYLAYPGRMMSDDRALFRTMQRAAELGLLVLVHAENGHAIDVLVEEALAAGHVEPEWHGHTRPPLTEAEAVSRATVLARIAGAELYVVHLSSLRALEEVRRAAADGAGVHAETCSHYLVLDESMLAGAPREEAARYVCSPPTRSKDDQAGLWRALGDGGIEVLASDHCPFALRGEKIVEGDFTHIMNGLPGVEQRLMIGYSGVARGAYSIERFVDITSTTPARLAGLYPRKGGIAIGSDADLVILDPAGRTRFSAETHHSAVDYLPYEGIEVDGAIRDVFAGGRRVLRDGELQPAARGGRFLARSTIAPTASRGRRLSEPHPPEPHVLEQRRGATS